MPEGTTNGPMYARVQLRRERARNLQGPRHPAVQPPRPRSKAWRSAGYAMGATVEVQLHPRRVHGRAGSERFSSRRWPRRTDKRACSARDILGSAGVDFDLHLDARRGRVHLRRGDGASSSRSRARRGKPRFKPPFPAQYAASTDGRPPSITPRRSRRVPAIMRNGARTGSWSSARPNNSAGTVKCFSVSGHVARPGNFEVPLGVSVQRDLLEHRGRHAGTDAKLKAVIPGGSSVPPLPGDDHDGGRTMDYDSHPARRARLLGTRGQMVVMDDRPRPW